MGVESAIMTGSDGSTRPGSTVAVAVSGTVPGVTWITATAIVVADMVGVGVFTSLGFPRYAVLSQSMRASSLRSKT